MAQILATAGCSVLKEQAVPGQPELRPADVLVTGFGRRPLAIDFSVVTPLRPSAHSAQPGSLLDETARLKCRKYKAACHAAGWDFMPFVVCGRHIRGPAERRQDVPQLGDQPPFRRLRPLGTTRGWTSGVECRDRGRCPEGSHPAEQSYNPGLPSGHAAEFSGPAERGWCKRAFGRCGCGVDPGFQGGHGPFNNPIA